jgi:hypothetical protein
VGGASFIRVDVPEIDGRPAFSKLFGAGSIFCITPMAEDVAMMYARQLKQTPLSVYDLPDDVRAKLRAPALTGPIEIDSDGEDLDDYDATGGEF